MNSPVRRAEPARFRQVRNWCRSVGGEDVCRTPRVRHLVPCVRGAPSRVAAHREVDGAADPGDGAMNKPGYETLSGCCDGDADGLREALGDDYEVVFENYHSEGYGHHGGDALFKLPDGRMIHASCGGCSCDGSGEWSYVDPSKAHQYIPEDRR